MTAFPDPLARTFTLGEYLEFEETSATKHEFHAGEVVAMSGASPAHALVTANAIRALGNLLEDSPCSVYSSDLKIYVEAVDRVYYPDASIICGALQFHPPDEKRRLVINPRVIVEVLSPTTEAYDRRANFRDYRSLASLEEYVLISQDQAIIETFFRQPDGNWMIGGAYSGLEAVAPIRCLKIALRASHVYARVSFPRTSTPVMNEKNDD